MAAWTSAIYPQVYQLIAEAGVDLSSDTITAHLTNRTPLASDAQLSDIVEIETGGGYTQGTGIAVTVDSSAMNGSTYELTLSGTIGLTATGTVSPFQYVVICFSGVTDDPILISLDLGEEVTLLEDHQLTIDVDGVVLFQLATAA